ncbi:MAG: hypothetical protein JWO45_248, partial [Spartobacteria bacterium]|nr:hypothetical protein [Spartobacteria bacterium]
MDRVRIDPITNDQYLEGWDNEIRTDPATYYQKHAKEFDERPTEQRFYNHNITEPMRTLLT